MANLNTIAHEQQEQRVMLEIIMRNQAAILHGMNEQNVNRNEAIIMHRITIQWLSENGRHPSDITA